MGASIWDRLKAAVGGGDGGDGELGRDDLIARISDGIGALSRYGARGRRVFPEEVRVVIAVGDASLTTIEAFVRDTGFDRDVERRLGNAFPDADGPLPVRGYVVEAGPRSEVSVLEARRAAVALVVAGGDRDGAVTPAPPGRRVIYAGRGEWHGAGQDLRNDLVLTDTIRQVPRRAIRLERRGGALIVHPLDAGDAVCVVSADGRRVRPARMPAGTAELRVGDHLEIDVVDGPSLTVRCVAQEGG